MKHANLTLKEQKDASQIIDDFNTLEQDSASVPTVIGEEQEVDASEDVTKQLWSLPEAESLLAPVDPRPKAKVHVMTNLLKGFQTYAEQRVPSIGGSPLQDHFCPNSHP